VLRVVESGDAGLGAQYVGPIVGAASYAYRTKRFGSERAHNRDAASAGHDPSTGHDSQAAVC
jgi:hypothetical protein